MTKKQVQNSSKSSTKAKQTSATKTTPKTAKTFGPKKTLVKHVYLNITITKLHECDIDRIDKSEPDWVKLGFKHDPEREAKYYQDCSEHDITYYMRYDIEAGVKFDDIFAKVQKTYEKHHADYNWFDCSFEFEDGSIELYKWYVFRFQNLGIMRDLDQVKKYSYNHYWEGKNIFMKKLAGKMRPFREEMREFKAKDAEEKGGTCFRPEICA
jgi:hypothetical protein